MTGQKGNTSPVTPLTNSQASPPVSPPTNLKPTLRNTPPSNPQSNPLQNAVLVDGGKRLSIFLPLKQKRRARVREVILPHGLDPLASFGKTEHETLCLNLARAFRWKELLDDGKFGSVNELAKHGGVDRAYIGRLLRLTLLAPDIVEAILEGQEPDGLTLPDLLQPLPWLWEEQRGMLGVEGLSAFRSHTPLSPPPSLHSHPTER